MKAWLAYFIRSSKSVSDVGGRRFRRVKDKSQSADDCRINQDAKSRSPKKEVTAKDYIKEKWASKIESHGRLLKAEILTIILIPSGVGAKGGTREDVRQLHARF